MKWCIPISWRLFANIFHGSFSTIFGPINMHLYMLSSTQIHKLESRFSTNIHFKTRNREAQTEIYIHINETCINKSKIWKEKKSRKKG